METSEDSINAGGSVNVTPITPTTGTGAVTNQLGFSTPDANTKYRLKWVMISVVGDGTIKFMDGTTPILPTFGMNSNSIITLDLSKLGIEVLTALNYTTTGVTSFSFQFGVQIVGK